jgi:predicted metal-dependent phosphoesterase TrpH
MWNSVWADLHIHTVLSPCAEVEMIPPLIVERACQLGLGLIAITDHNASDNAAAVMEAARGSGLQVLPGMELQTREEVHLLCLFDSLEGCGEWQSYIRGKLPPLENREEFFGPQFVVDATGDLVRTEHQLLATSADVGLEEAIAGVHALGGLAIPAHVDRPSFSLLANLGFVPERLAADALEVSRHFRPPDGNGKWPQLRGWPLLVDGDAHRLQEIQGRVQLKIASPVLAELAMALKGFEGRQLRVNWQ